MADVPLGAFLSGGIDSAAITATMTELGTDPVNTFSVAFEEPEANELSYARIVAKAFGTKHREIVLTPNEFSARLPQLVWHEDEPIAHPSSVALNAVARLAAEHVKVVLTGEGSDELLGGYGRYARTLVNMRLGEKYESVTPSIVQKWIRKWLNRKGFGGSLRRKARRTFLARPSDIEHIYFDNFAVFDRSAQRGMLTARIRELVSGSDPYEAMRRHWDRSSERNLLERLLIVDSKTYLHELLMKQDQMSMAASIESRVPFLDHTLVEFASRLPPRMKLRRLKTKYILRRATAELLPREILRRPKMGFPVPVGAWLRGPFATMVDEFIRGGRARDRDIFERSYVDDLVRAHAMGLDHSEPLWALVNFEIWQRIFMDGQTPEEVADVVAQISTPTGVQRRARVR